MTRYLISFDDGAMAHIPDEDFLDVAKAAHEVIQEAVNAGVWVFGGGLASQMASVVGTDGIVTDGPYPETKEVIGGFCVVDVTSREEALSWAAKTAVACRCAQEVRELLPDPEQDAMLRQAERDGDVPTPSDRRRPAALDSAGVARGRVTSSPGLRGIRTLSRPPWSPTIARTGRLRSPPP